MHTKLSLFFQEANDEEDVPCAKIPLSVNSTTSYPAPPPHVRLSDTYNMSSCTISILYTYPTFCSLLWENPFASFYSCKSHQSSDVETPAGYVGSSNNKDDTSVRQGPQAVIRPRSASHRTLVVGKTSALCLVFKDPSAVFVKRQCEYCGHALSCV